MSAPDRRVVSVIAIAVLGINLWVSVLWVPLYHHPKLRAVLVMVLSALPALPLAAGLWRRSGWLLLAAFPSSLLPAVIADKRLASGGVLSRWSFLLIAGALLAYTLGCALGLASLENAVHVSRGRDLSSERTAGSRWRTRRRIYAALALFSALHPLALLCGLFLRPGVMNDLKRYYPDRAPAAAMLFGVLVIGLWLAVFYTQFAVPLRAHVRGDPRLRQTLTRQRTERMRRKLRPRFYVQVAIALSLIALFFLLL